MSSQLYRITFTTTQIIILLYSFINGLIQINCLYKTAPSCPIYRAEYIKINPNILDEFTLFTFFAISLIGFFNVAQLIKSKTLSTILLFAQIALIILQKAIVKTIVPF
jgi:hypothetical protein